MLLRRKSPRRDNTPAAPGFQVRVGLRGMGAPWKKRRRSIAGAYL